MHAVVLRRSVAVSFLFALVSLYGLGATAHAAEHSVAAVDNRFEPRTVEVVAGDTVVWTNEGTNPHTVTAADGSWASGNLNPGDTFRRQFSSPGTIDYYCEYHGTSGGSGMAGSVAVRESDGGGGEAQARSIEPACPEGRVEEDGFRDVPEDNPHEFAVDCVVWWEVASGHGDGTYRPANPVSRAQMATFIARAMTAGGYSLPDDPPDHFDDDNGSSHEHAINQLADVGVVSGTGGRTYSPGRDVSRGQMAKFLVEAYERASDRQVQASSDYFDDDDGTTFEDHINRAAEAGFAAGVSAREYAPDRSVQRDQMGSFLARVLAALVEDGEATPPS